MKLNQTQINLVKSILESEQTALVAKINGGKVLDEKLDAAMREREYQINLILEALS